jgi:hypothetical protein
MDVQLREFATVKLDGSGNGTAKVGPLSARETWQPQNVAVSATSNVKEASCNIYVGDRVAASNFRDATLSGSTGDSTGKVSGDSVKTGHYIWAVWSGGDANATATMVVTGSKSV